MPHLPAVRRIQCRQLADRVPALYQCSVGEVGTFGTRMSGPRTYTSTMIDTMALDTLPTLTPESAPADAGLATGCIILSPPDPDRRTQAAIVLERAGARCFTRRWEG